MFFQLLEDLSNIKWVTSYHFEVSILPKTQLHVFLPSPIHSDLYQECAEHVSNQNYPLKICPRANRAVALSNFFEHHTLRLENSFVQALKVLSQNEILLFYSTFFRESEFSYLQHPYEMRIHPILLEWLSSVDVKNTHVVAGLNRCALSTAPRSLGKAFETPHSSVSSKVMLVCEGRCFPKSFVYQQMPYSY